MPALINHSFDYANQKLEGMNLEIIVVGDGTTIKDQYPSADSDIVSSGRIFLLTDGGNIIMPNMTNWTKKDLTAFWKMSGISIVVDGNGKVVSQNIQADEVISKNDEIEVKME